MSGISSIRTYRVRARQLCTTSCTYHIKAPPCSIAPSGETDVSHVTVSAQDHSSARQSPLASRRRLIRASCLDPELPRRGGALDSGGWNIVMTQHVWALLAGARLGCLQGFGASAARERKCARKGLRLADLVRGWGRARLGRGVVHTGRGGLLWVRCTARVMCNCLGRREMGWGRRGTKLRLAVRICCCFGGRGWRCGWLAWVEGWGRVVSAIPLRSQRKI